MAMQDISPVKSPIGKTIETYLEVKGISAYRLAKLAGCHETTLSKIRQGQRGCSPEMAIALADALGAPREEFLRAAGHGDLVQARQETGGPENLVEKYYRLLEELGAEEGGRIPFKKLSKPMQRAAIAQLESIKASVETVKEPEAGYGS